MPQGGAALRLRRAGDGAAEYTRRHRAFTPASTPKSEDTLAGMSSRRREAAELVDRRVCACATAAVPVALALWCAAVATDFWFHVVPEDGLPISLNRTGDGPLFVRSYSGLWTICRFTIAAPTAETPPLKECHNHRLFPSADFIRSNPEVDSTILDYTRTEAAFSLISACLMALGFGFSLYTFREPRYMFRRLAGGVHLIAAACVLVVVEVVVQSVEYEAASLTARHPRGASWSFGFSFGLACGSGAVEAAVGLAFLLRSGKRKGGGGDEPNILGRA